MRQETTVTKKYKYFLNANQLVGISSRERIPSNKGVILALIWM
jgi:hypothetical protein